MALGKDLKIYFTCDESGLCFVRKERLPEERKGVRV
jgi:hypothetical protein